MLAFELSAMFFASENWLGGKTVRPSAAFR